jgi:putative colanic acid biosynthesis acetyltransferase WcaF
VHLAQFDNSWYYPGRPKWVQALWFLAGLPLIRCQLIPSSAFRRGLLRVFGATIGSSVVIKPGVRVKYPWRLKVGDHSWIGEDVWLDNLGDIEIGSDVCISQGAYLCTGNHDWSAPAFDLRVGGIRIENQAWIGAKAILCPGVRMGQGAVATAGSVVTRMIGPLEIHAGNPAAWQSTRKLREPCPTPQCLSTQ